MPCLKLRCSEKNPHPDGAHRRQRIADQQHPFLIPPVGHRPGKNAHQHIGRIGTDRQQCGGERRAGTAVEPDDQGKIGHGAAKGGKGLGKPQRQKGFQFPEGFHR